MLSCYQLTGGIMSSGLTSRHLGMRHYFYLFIAPALILYTVFFIYPFIQGVGYSFLSWNGIDPEIPNQMDIKQFDTLVTYNVPIYFTSKKYEKDILPKINDISDKIFFNSFYEQRTENGDYIFQKNVNFIFGEEGKVDIEGRREVEKSDLERLSLILKMISYKGILNHNEKAAIYKHYEEMGSNYRLKPGTSMFARNRVRRLFKKIGYENIRNVGFDNFKRLGTDPRFKEVVSFTLFFTFFNVVFINIFALLIALALDSNIRNKNSLRGMFFLPNILSLIIVAYIWSFIFRQGFSALYEVTGWKIFSTNWLTDLNKAPWAIVLTSVWQGLGYIMVIYLAGLQTIPSDILEVASIDGANGFKKFTKITLPLLFPSITICFFITLTNSLKTFEIMLALTDGGFRTTSFVLNVYQEAFRRNRVGYSTAQAIVLLLIIMIVSTIQLTIMKKREIEY